MSDDKDFMDWLASYFRSGASPSAAMRITKLNTQIDIVDILGSINVPTLILQRTHDIDVKIEEGRFIAERILGAKFVELEGNDHLFWAGDTEVVLEEMKAFILSVKPELVNEKKLYTVMVGSIDTGETLTVDYLNLIQKHIKNYKGSIIEYSEKSFTVTFEGPSRAIDCGTSIIKAIVNRNTEISLGIDIKECSMKHCIGEEIEDLIEAVSEKSKPNQIIITQTVKNLLVGSSVCISPYKAIFKIKSGEPSSLYTCLLYTSPSPRD